MKSLALSFAFLASTLIAPCSQAHEGHDHAGASAAKATAPTISSKQAATRAVLRDLWVEHVFWIRNYVNASAAGNAGQKQVAVDEVLANTTRISGAVASFYGKAAGDRMLALLAGHWGAVKAYSDASFAKDSKAQQQAATALIANAKDIASFLAKANPNLPEPTLVALLSAHGAHHIAQIQQVMQGDYVGEARTWEAMRTHMFTIADALADALAKQFPSKF